jgi:hypothetical protein
VGATEAQLRREIDLRRERIGDTLEVIGDRVSPGRMAQRRKAAVTGAFRRAKETVMGAAEDAQGRMGDTIGGMTQHAGDGVGSMGERMSGAAHSAAGTVQHAPEAITQRAQGNPLAAGVIAFGAGMLLATVLPKTRAEQQAAQQLQPQIQGAVDAARETGQQLAQTAKDDVQQAAVDLRETTRESAEHVTQEAKQAAQGVAGAGREAATNLGEQAKGAAGTVRDEGRSTVQNVRDPGTT